MRETNFIEQNKKKWEEFEQMLKVKDKDPDKLSDLFVQIMDDLSFARTFYPNRSVRFYLNNLAQKVYLNIYKKKRTGLRNLKQFWVYDLPKAIYGSRKELLLSFIIFTISVLIGVFSSRIDPEFPKVILGESYVEMTKEFIKSGDPMAVYKQSGEMDMLLSISFNNLRIAFFTFVSGVMLAVGTIIILIYNGIMVGSFQYFFYDKGVFWESFTTIWLHGTLEISMIVISGGAGLKLGSGLLFPGSYSRAQAFKISAKKGLFLMLGVAPILFFAAIIESFITRYTDVSDLLKVGLILASLIFIIGYFIVIPFIQARKGFFTSSEEEKLPAESSSKIDYGQIKSNGVIFSETFILYKKYFPKIVSATLILAIFYSIPAIYFLNNELPARLDSSEWMFLSGWLNLFIINLFGYSASHAVLLWAINALATAVIITVTDYLFTTENALRETGNFTSYVTKQFLKSLLVAAIVHSFFFLNNGLALLAFMLLTPIALFLFTVLTREGKALGRTFGLLGGSYWKLTAVFLILCITGTIYYFLFASPLTYIYLEFINMNLNLTEEEARLIYISFYTLISFTGLNLILPLFIISFNLSYYSTCEMKEANKLKERIMNFGVRTKNVLQK